MGQSIHASTQVYLADSMGELWLWYALSQVCFGGSLNEPGGGHNILEPMVLNVPTWLDRVILTFKRLSMSSLMKMLCLSLKMHSRSLISG